MSASKAIASVRIEFTCTACGALGSVAVPWGGHHTLPKGWRSRDVVPTFVLSRRTDHVFACSKECRLKLDELYPPPKKPKWFLYA